MLYLVLPLLILIWCTVFPYPWDFDYWGPGFTFSMDYVFGSIDALRGIATACVFVYLYFLIFKVVDFHKISDNFVKGLETIAWKPREKCLTPNGDYNPDKDVRFFSDAPDMYFQLTDGQFGIFYPEDVHAPMIGEGEIKKLVFKVKI